MAMTRAALAVALLLAVASAGRVANQTAKVNISAHVAAKVVAAPVNTTVVVAAPVTPVVQATAIAATHASEMADLKRFAQKMEKQERGNLSQVHEKWSFDDNTNSTSTASMKVPAKAAVVPNFLRNTAAKKSDGCECHFKNFCTCEAAMEFMDCIETACTSADCDCHQLQYKHACLMMSETCHSLKMTCETIGKTTQKATCTSSIDASKLPTTTPEPKLEDRSTADIMKDLDALKEEKCQLETDDKNGWLNADERQAVMQDKIDRRMAILKQRREKTPEMHCEKHFKEYEYPTKQKSMALRAATPLAALVGAAACLFA